MPGRGSIALAVAALVATGCSRTDEERRASPPAASPAQAAAGGFEVTGGTREARERFASGLRALHSFWYEEARREFQAAIDADRTFSMAYWGLAMSQSRLLWGEDDAGAALAILARLPRPDRLSAREQAWIRAARVLFGKGNALENRRAFAAAMEDLHARFPDDESATFLAAALLATLYPGSPDETAVRDRAAALAGEVFARSPDHPGAAHYLIHAEDTRERAARALPAAQRYAAIAPEAFHAQHMPAHIFSWLGMWKEVLASCQKAWDASISAARRHGLGPDHHDYHSLSWLVEVNFELGRRSEADRAFALFAGAVRGGLGAANRIAYVGQVSSYLARTGEWKRVDELLAPLEAAPAGGPGAAAPPGAPVAAEAAPGAASCTAHPAVPSGSPMADFEERAVLTVKARAAATERDRAATRALLDRIAAVDARLKPFLAATQPPDLVARQARIDAETARALEARARGDQRGLLAALRAIAAAEGPPGGEGVADAYIRAEGIADTLLALGDAEGALASYEKVVRDHPGRAHSMLGAARAARKAGKPEVARDWYQKLAAQWSEAEPGTDGLAEARAAVP